MKKSRRKKKFIDPKKAVSFQLVYRSTRDPLLADSELPELVLHQTSGGEFNIENKNPNGREIFSGDDFEDNPGTYDYTQHLKLMGTRNGSVFVGSDGRHTPATPFNPLNQPSFFGSNTEEIEDDEMDQDILDALHNTDGFEELTDDFVVKAGVNEEDLDYYEDSGEMLDPFDYTDLDFGIDDDFNPNAKIKYLTEKDETRKKTPVVDDRKTTIVDEMFDAALNRFEKVNPLELEEGDIEASGLIDINNLSSILDEFLEENTKPTISDFEERSDSDEVDIKVISYDSEDEMNYERIYVEEKVENWDVETILSSYTNTENHPSIIASNIVSKKIELNRMGIPRNVFSYEIDTEESSTVRENKGIKRNKTENLEDKKERKRLIKLQRAERRKEKKEMKNAFHSEYQKQKKHITPMSNRSKFRLN